MSNEFVVKDKGGDWHYEEGVYTCINANGKKISKIYAEYLPDPVKIWQSKALAAGVDTGSMEGERLRPSNVVFKLWEHKNANVN